MKKTNLAHKIRLYWGENYAPKSQSLQKAIKKALIESVININMYPGGLQDAVKKAIAKICHVPLKSIILGAGIEGLLINIFKTLVKAGDEVITLHPTFSAYEHNAESCDAKTITIPVGLNTKVTAEDVLINASKKTKLICIASPNTTTGIYHISKKDIINILKKFKGVVVIDECYFGIGKQTVADLINDFDNLLVLRSVSKNWGLAGIRLGFGLGSAKIIGQLEAKSTHLAPDPLPTSSYLVFLAVLPYIQGLEKDYVKFQSEFIDKLKEVPGIKVHDSHTTYIPVEYKSGVSLSTVIGKLKKAGIEFKDTSNLGYLLFTVPPRKYWGYTLSCLQKSLALL